MRQKRKTLFGSEAVQFLASSVIGLQPVKHENENH